MSFHEGSNWQAKKQDEGKPLYNNMENKYPIGIDPQEIWDEFSEYVDDDSDSFSRYAGRSVMLFDSFVRALAKIQQPPTGAIWVKASSGLPDDNIQRIWKWNKSGNPEWKRIELDTSDGIKRWVKADKVDFDDIDLQYLDESSIPSKESDAVDFAEYAGTIAYYDDRYSIWKSLEEGGTIDGKLSVTTEQLYELFLKQKEVNP